MSNKLIDESSPYLLQHANNPVDWYPWGDEAFGRAQQENKPVLVSIGYAACHWCHVMEHESFEDETVAAFMNEHFICIKVDREEHPDVDHLYMDALQAMSGSGGWPLNMFVTSDRKPFYGGTYFPPKSMYGRSSWMELLVAMQRAWAEKPEEISLQSEQMLKHLVQASTVESVAAGAYQISQQDIDSIATNLLRNADKDYGGFGGAPKFPPTGSIQFLLEYHHLQEDKNNALAKEALEHALLSLDKMIEGGIYDQIGGGFSRYATDAQWLVPHFEKMLYDNALLVSVLSNAYRITKKERYRRTIEDTIRFCRRELGAADSPGFYCALDADSEGVEGKFYTWTWKDWTALMGQAHPALAAYFGVSEQGNWEETNILNVALDDEEICNRYQLDPGFWEQLKEDAKHRLLVKRTERIRPATDDKMLLSWNALMNIALVDAALALEHETYLQDALAHARWMLQVFRDEQGKLLHTYKNGRARITAKLDDYAYLIKALYHAAAASLDASLLLEAAQLMKQVEAEFLHEDRNFFYFSSQLQRDIPVRKVELYDGATPAANSMMMENLWNMGNLMERSNWIEQSEAMMFAQKQAALRYPSSFARWAIWLQRYNTGLKQLVIAGTDAEAMLSEWHRDYYPQVFAVATTEDGAGVKALQHKYVAGVTRLYVCAQFVCKSPVQSVAEARGSIRN